MRSRHLKLAVVAGAAALLAGASGCGGGGSASSRADTTPTSTRAVADSVTRPHARVIDEQRGTYRRAGLLQSRGDVIGALGQPVAVGHSGEYTPVGRTPGPNFHPGAGTCRIAEAPSPRGFLSLRYPTSSFTFARSAVCSVFVVDPAAATQRGVGIGDRLSQAKDAYPGIRCSRHLYENDEGVAYINFPYCFDRVARSRYLWFGGDPIDTIELSTNRRG